MLRMKPEDKCYYDFASLGEVMLRFDPGEGRIRNARSFNVYEGGGEYNVAQGIASCFGKKSAAVTALADNEIGRLIENLMLADGVECSFVKLTPCDGMGKDVRNGLNFTERGFGARKGLGVSDRANTAAGQLRPSDIDWDKLFGEKGVRWFHTGGIFAALSDSSLETLLTAVKKAHEYGTVVSYDLNYRASLYASREKDCALRIAEKILPYVDVLIGNDIEYPLCMGSDLTKKCDKIASAAVLERVCEKYKNLAVACAIYISPDTNTLSAVCRADGRDYFADDYAGLEILDPVGAGDAYAAGFFYGLMQGYSFESCLAYGAGHSALSFTTPGDTSCVSLREVEAFIKGSTGFVR